MNQTTDEDSNPPAKGTTKEQALELLSNDSDESSMEDHSSDASSVASRLQEDEEPHLGQDKDNPVHPEVPALLEEAKTIIRKAKLSEPTDEEWSKLVNHFMANNIHSPAEEDTYPVLLQCWTMAHVLVNKPVEPLPTKLMTVSPAQLNQELKELMEPVLLLAANNPVQHWSFTEWFSLHQLWVSTLPLSKRVNLETTMKCLKPVLRLLQANPNREMDLLSCISGAGPDDLPALISQLQQHQETNSDQEMEESHDHAESYPPQTNDDLTTAAQTKGAGSAT